MKRITVFFILTLSIFIFFCISATAQKPEIGLETFKKWPTLGKYEISNDGNFAFFEINNQPLANITGVVKSTTNDWQMKIEGFRNATFFSNSRYLIGQVNDSLAIINLNSGRLKKMFKVSKFECLNGRNRKGFIVSTSGMKNELVFVSFLGDTSILASDVSFFKVLQDDRIVYQSGSKGQRVGIVDLNSGKSKIIFYGNNSSNIICDRIGKQIAFFVTAGIERKIWLYKDGICEKLNISTIRGSDSTDHYIPVPGSNWRFSEDCNQLFFDLKLLSAEKPRTDLVIWNYNDILLQSSLDPDLNIEKSTPAEKSFLTTYLIGKKMTLHLLDDNQFVVRLTTHVNSSDSILLIASSNVNLREGTIFPNSTINYEICYTKTGRVIPLQSKGGKLWESISFSPSGRFLVYFDCYYSNYFTYEFSTSIQRMISKDVSDNLLRVSTVYPEGNGNYPIGIAGWSNNDEILFIHTEFDMWMLDPLAKKKPVNITSGYGKKNGFIFYLAVDKIGSNIIHNNIIHLSAFDTKTKNFAFFELNLKSRVSLILKSTQSIYSGSMVDYCYNQCEFKKSKDADLFLIKYSMYNVPNNLMYTHDFINFYKISDLQPQLANNWIKSELHRYKDSMGNSMEGILYKPENFDGNKNYPIILNYYTTKTNLLNKFLDPQLTGGDISVPILVSRGFLVFQPNIYFKPGEVGLSALNSVLAAANYLSTLKYVNAEKMGIAGHSFGGLETNFIVTHSDRFACALSGSGVSDLTSAYNSTWGDGTSQQAYYLMSQPRMTFAPFEKPNSYITNSPIFNANNMNTPLLLMHNPEDTQVPFEQSKSFFIQLRSLSKPVWMLTYKGEGHGIFKESNNLDYYNKISEFFDFFLKDEKRPGWLNYKK